MNQDETKMLLADVARRDNRPPSFALLAMWHDALDDIDFHDAKAALKILNRETTDYLMPAHIRNAVKRARRDRARPSLEAAKARAAARAACALCDDRGYRLPARRVVCDHSEPKQIGWAQRFRRQIEGGAA